MVNFILTRKVPMEKDGHKQQNKLKYKEKKINIAMKLLFLRPLYLLDNNYIFPLIVLRVIYEYFYALTSLSVSYSAKLTWILWQVMSKTLPFLLGFLDLVVLFVKTNPTNILFVSYLFHKWNLPFLWDTETILILNS